MKVKELQNPTSDSQLNDILYKRVIYLSSSETQAFPLLEGMICSNHTGHFDNGV